MYTSYGSLKVLAFPAHLLLRGNNIECNLLHQGNNVECNLALTLYCVQTFFVRFFGSSPSSSDFGEAEGSQVDETTRFPAADF